MLAFAMTMSLSSTTTWWIVQRMVGLRYERDGPASTSSAASMPDIGRG